MAGTWGRLEGEEGEWEGLLVKVHEAAHDVDGHREDDGGVVLCGDAVEGLEVTELQGGRAVGDHLGRVTKRPARLVLPLGRDHLKRNILIICLSLDVRRKLEILLKNLTTLKINPF